MDTVASGKKKKKIKSLSGRFGHPLKLVAVRLASISRGRELEPSINFKK